jgi:hypothetical protein
MDFEKMVPERYKITHDTETGSFRILDTWHASIKNLPDLDQDIPINSPALKIVNALEVNALLGELDKLGWLEKYKKNLGVIQEPMVHSAQKSLHELAIENITAIAKSTGNESNVNEGVAREALVAIREVVTKATI